MTTFDRMQFKVAVRDTVLFVLALALVLAGFSAFAQQPVSVGGGGTGSGPMKRGNFLKPEQYATQGALSLYVDGSGSGNDGFTCTAPGTPCATIQGAVNKIPFLVQHPVTVGIDGGSYAGFALVNHTFNAANTTNGAYISISGGAQVNTTPITGTATGTITSVTTDSVGFHTVIDNTQLWTAPDTNISTRFLTLTGGTGAGQVCPIINNTLTALAVSCVFSPAPVAGTTYAITTPSTTITSAVNQPATSETVAGNSAGAIFSEISYQRSNSTNTVLLQDVGFSGAVVGARVTQAQGVKFLRNRFATTTAGIILTGSSNLSVTNTSLPTGAGYGISIANAGFGDATTLIVASSFFSTSNANGAVRTNTTSSAGTTRITDSQLESSAATGAILGFGDGGPMSLLLARIRIKCGSAASNTGIIFTQLNAATGLVGGPAAFGSIASSSIETCGTGLSVKYGYNQMVVHSSVTFLSNSTAVSAVGGGRVNFAAAVPTFTTNGTDISIDGDTYTRAAFVALSPNAVTNMNYLTSVYLQP